MDLWNQKLTRENLTDFYQSTVEMVYSSVFGITKESTRAEQAIIKSYIDIYQLRGSTNAEDVIYVFGDILLKNANEIVEKYPLPDNLTFMDRVLDEYTRNFMLEKIIVKIDSAGYKVAEFISSDSKRGKSPKTMQKIMELLPVTPLLVIQLILLIFIVWGVSTAAITLPYKNDSLVNEKDIYDELPLEEKYVSMLAYYPLNPEFPVIEPESDINNPDNSGEAPDSESQTGLTRPSVVTESESEASATRG